MKFFKSNKPKNSELNPTPLALPPETPIHARHAASQPPQPQTQSRRSLDATDSVDRSNWAAADPRQDDPNAVARTRQDSKHSVASLPPGASPPQTFVTGPPMLSQPQPSQVQSRSQLLRSPSLGTRSRANRESTKRRSGHIFPWPDALVPEKIPSSDTHSSDQRPPSIHSFDAHEVSREREGSTHKGGTGGRIADFFFASNKDVPRQGRQQRDGQYSIEEAIRMSLYFSFSFHQNVFANILRRKSGTNIVRRLVNST